MQEVVESHDYLHPQKTLHIKAVILFWILSVLLIFPLMLIKFKIISFEKKFQKERETKWNQLNYITKTYIKKIPSPSCAYLVASL